MWLRCPLPGRVFVLELMEDALGQRAAAIAALSPLTAALRNTVRRRMHACAGRSSGAIHPLASPMDGLLCLLRAGVQVLAPVSTDTTIVPSCLPACVQVCPFLERTLPAALDPDIDAAQVGGWLAGWVGGWLAE